MYRAVCWTGLLIGVVSPLWAQWTQWGGPERNFHAGKGQLTIDQPYPRVQWRQPLGVGHASIVVDKQRLYTLFSEGEREAVVAMDRRKGARIWQDSYDTGYQATRRDYQGPHATPLLVDGRLFTLGIAFHLRAYAAADGRLLWQRDLMAEYQPRMMQSGYAASPIAFEDTVILPMGGSPGQGAIAVDQASGVTRWLNADFQVSHASPIQINIGERPQVLFNLRDEVAALAPKTGALLWRHALPQRGYNVAFTPLWDAVRMRLFISYPYGEGRGMRALNLLPTEQGAMRVAQLWHNDRFRPMHGNTVLLDDTLYGTARDEPGIFAALDAETGRLLWRERLTKATVMVVARHLLVLTEDGELLIIQPSRRKMRIMQRVSILEDTAWAVPTVVGKWLYGRDFRSVVAVQLAP